VILDRGDDDALAALVAVDDAKTRRRTPQPRMTALAVIARQQPAIAVAETDSIYPIRCRVGNFATRHLLEIFPHVAHRHL
jgi:hypothetical protein